MLRPNRTGPVPMYIGDLEGTQERVHINERQFRRLVHESGIQIVVHVDLVGRSPWCRRLP